MNPDVKIFYKKKTLEPVKIERVDYTLHEKGFGGGNKLVYSTAKRTPLWRAK